MQPINLTLYVIIGAFALLAFNAVGVVDLPSVSEIGGMGR